MVLLELALVAIAIEYNSGKKLANNSGNLTIIISLSIRVVLVFMLLPDELLQLLEQVCRLQPVFSTIIRFKVRKISRCPSLQNLAEPLAHT